MLFNSLEFLIFMPAAIAIYFALPYRYRWIFLLISSYYFYMCWKVFYIYLLLGSTVVDYICGLKIDRAQNPRTKKLFLIISVFLNMGFLFTYKYFDFLNGTLRYLCGLVGIDYQVPDLKLTLPVGISFYTFQSLGYIIDVYRGKLKAERNFFRFALYITYFPQLVAGPIERANNLMPQLKQHFDFDYVRFRNGLSLILWGLVKKLVIADRICEYTNVVFNHPAAYKGIQVWVADFFFIIQLYCDFSGYSVIALGTAGIMGVKLMQNFRQPLLAVNNADMWSRWHISLTTWFRDYLYVYIGGRRGSTFRMCLGVFTVFLVNGLWHGANWTFVAFGAIHGLALVIYYLYRRVEKRINAITGLDKRPTIIFIIGYLLGQSLFMLTGNFFRAANLPDAWTLVCNAFTISDGFPPLNFFRYPADMWISLIFIGVLYYSEYIGKYFGFENWLNQRSRLFKWAMLVAGLASVVMLGKWDAISFIYFQF